jgi:hypothetical protein
MVVRRPCRHQRRGKHWPRSDDLMPGRWLTDSFRCSCSKLLKSWWVMIQSEMGLLISGGCSIKAAGRPDTRTEAATRIDLPNCAGWSDYDDPSGFGVSLLAGGTAETLHFSFLNLLGIPKYIPKNSQKFPKVPKSSRFLTMSILYVRSRCRITYRARSHSLRCVFIFEGPRFSCRRHSSTLSWCSSCSTALADEQLLPRLHKLSPCRFNTMFGGPDELAAHVPRGLGDAEVLQNTFGLHVAAEGKHPEHIVEQVEKALPKYEDRGCGAIPPRSAKQGLRTLASESIDRLTSDTGSIIDVNIGQN